MLALPDVCEEILLATGAVLAAAEIPTGRSKFSMVGKAVSASAMREIQLTAPVIIRAKVHKYIKSAFES